MNKTHGNRSFTDRRMSDSQLVQFYLNQAKLAAAGIITRKSEAYFLRQAEYFRSTTEV